MKKNRTLSFILFVDSFFFIVLACKRVIFVGFQMYAIKNEMISLKHLLFILLHTLHILSLRTYTMLDDKFLMLNVDSDLFGCRDFLFAYSEISIQLLF